jgi:hypothetical protein
MYLGATNIKININRWNSSPIRIKDHYFPHTLNSKHRLNKLGMSGKESLNRLGDMQIYLTGLRMIASSRAKFVTPW